MFVVAIMQLATSVEAEAKPLADDLELTVYEAKLLLAVPAPTIVLTTVDRAKASKLLAALRARGHGAIACDGAAVASSDSITLMKRFRISADGIAIDGPPGGELAFADISVLLAAHHRVQVETNTEHTEKKFDMTRAVLSGGLVVRKSVTTTSHASSSDMQRVLYVFRASGEPPWMLREREASYAALARVAPTARENFDAMVALFRERAPDAPYDARLLTARRVPETMRVAGDAQKNTRTTSSASGIDLLAHLLAAWLARQALASGLGS